MAGVLVIGGEASGVAVKRSEAEIFEVELYRWSMHIRGLGDLAVNNLLQGVDALAIGAEGVLLSRQRKFWSISWRVPGSWVRPREAMFEGRNRRRRTIRCILKQFRLAMTQTIMNQRICARVQRTYLAVVVVVDT